MTEQEWLISTDVQAMLAFLRTGVRGVTYDNPTIAAGVPLITPRKLRLFACACARQVWDGLTDPRIRRAVLQVEEEISRMDVG